MRHSRRNVLAGLAFALAFLMEFVLLPLPVTAQSFYGSITGIVTDPTGGVLPGASVTAINIGTNAKASAITGADGSYRFVNLVPAEYQVDVELSSFKRMTRGPIPVRVQATAHVDFKLEVGEITETVEVTAEAKLLQTESGELSSVVTGEQVQEMPLNGRNVMNLIALAPGVVPQGSSEGPTTMNQGTHTNNAGWGNFQIGGGIAGQSAWFIDGGTINVLNSNTIALVPTQDAIQEFRVSSNAISAEYGRSGGGVVNMTTKSGTNSYHGSAYGYLRNKNLNANDFFSELNNKDKQEWSQYQYGGTLAGPLVKNKLFFFGAYEHFLSRLNSPTTAIIPTEEMRNGTFHRAITDPTGRGCVSQPAANTWQINPSCFDPSSLIMRDVYYPPPNTTGQAYNWFSVPQVGNDGDQFNVRLDYNVSDNHRIFARYTYWNATDIPFSTYGNVLTSNASSQNKSQQAVLGDTLTLSPTTVLDVRLSYLREYYDDLQPSEGLDLSMFGPAWGALNGQVNFQTTPNYTFSGSNNLAASKGQLTSLRWFNVYGFAASVTKILSNHTVKLGGEIRLKDGNVTGTSTTHSGRLNYDTSIVGDEYAAFLMGLPTSLEIGKLYPTSTYNWYQGYYVTDTWTVGKKLTLNLGLRWELPGNMAERYDRATVLLPDTIDPATNVKGTLALVDSDLWSSRYMMKTRYNLFAPRASFAYQLNDKTVLRGGYGLNYLPPDMVMEGGMFALSSPINSAQNIFFNRKDPNTGLLASPYRVTSNPFPQGLPEPTGRTNPNFMQNLLKQNLVGYDPDQNYPHTQQWNVSLSHEFPGELLVEAAYAGSKGSNLALPGGNNYMNMNLNQLDSQYWSLGSALQATSPTNPTMTVGQSLRPYPYYLNMDLRGAFTASTTYKSAYVRVEKRFRGSGVISANYTWSRAEGNADTDKGYLESGTGGRMQDFNNLDAEYSLSSYDVPNRFVVSFVLEMPFGKGKRFGSDAGGFVGALISGWSVNGIYTYRNGYPLNLYTANTPLVTFFGLGRIRPNLVAGCDADLGSDQSFQKWFNKDCFAHPGNYAVGDAPRNYDVVRLDGVNNFDLSLGKAFNLGGDTKLDFRVESFNLFNRTQFGPPGQQVGAANFGVVSSQQNKQRLIQLGLRLTF